MDVDLFDAFVRSLDRTVPRRVALVGTLGTGLAGLLTRYGSESGAARKRKKKKCKAGKKKCGKKCIPESNCCLDANCGDGGNCDNGTCLCPAETALCGGTCVDLAADGANCGACGNACDTNVCLHGFCACQDQDDCNGCVCSLRREDSETACSGDLTAQPCDVDNDCPARSFCRDTIDGGFCSVPCPAEG